MMTQMIRTYTELSKIPDFRGRFRYLALYGKAYEPTFGDDRWVNQDFYRSKEWRRVRNEVVIRDHGCDLGVEGFEIPKRAIVHHMNPITEKDIVYVTNFLLDPENLITVSEHTHNAIHFGNESMIEEYFPTERTPNDTCPWK